MERRFVNEELMQNIANEHEEKELIERFGINFNNRNDSALLFQAATFKETFKIFYFHQNKLN